MVDQNDPMNWIENMLATPSELLKINQQRTITFHLLDLEAEQFVKIIFNQLGYTTLAKYRSKNRMFAFLAENGKQTFLVDIKLRNNFNSSMLQHMFRTEGLDEQQRICVVFFERSTEIQKQRNRLARYFANGKIIWISVEDLLGLSNVSPETGKLDKNDGMAFLVEWRKKMKTSLTNYFAQKGLEKPNEIANSIIKLADDQKSPSIDDFDVVRALNLKIEERFPRFFESFAFYCEECGKRYRSTPVMWSDRTNSYSVICPECKQKVNLINLKIPITINIQTVVLDTSSIIEGTPSRLISQNILPRGTFFIIPEVVDQELEMMEKPPFSVNIEAKKGLKRKFKEANKELDTLVKQDLSGYIQLERHVGNRLSEDEIKRKLQGIDRNAADRLIVETCKQIQGVLLTKDEGLATRASADKVNVFLISK